MEKLIELIQRGYQIDKSMIMANKEVSLFQPPYNFSPIELVKLYKLIQKKYDVEFNMEDFLNRKFITIESIYRIIQQKEGERDGEYS